LDETLNELQQRVGHPADKWDALKECVQTDHVRQFADVQADWLDLMWTLDAYRAARIVPRNMGNPKISDAKRLAGVYRQKGNWFATLLALLLENQTSHRLAARQNIQGFSQVHQIDIAWPYRDVDPLVCLETKVTGAPAIPGGDPERAAMADFSNRRKELKFAATDLKLFRRQELTSIDHWDVWRASAAPKCYFLWGARLSSVDHTEKMVNEVQGLVRTYLEGAGLVAWRAVGEGYKIVPLPTADRVSTIDDVLYRIASDIKAIAAPGTQPPAPVLPNKREVDVYRLERDTDQWQAAGGGT
jgi:hypothetical protein